MKSIIKRYKDRKMAKKILRIIEKNSHLTEYGCICNVIAEAHDRNLLKISYKQRNKILDWVKQNKPGHYDYFGLWFPLDDWASRVDYLKSFLK